MPSSTAQIVSAILLLAVLASCDSSPVDPVPPITVELSRSEIEVVPGTRDGPGPGPISMSYVNFVVQRNGYAGAVTYDLVRRFQSSAPNLPVVELVGPMGPGGAGIDTVGSVRISYPTGTATGTYEYVLRATAGAEGSVSTPITLRVVPFGLQGAAKSLTVARGRTNTMTLLIQGDGYAVSVATAGTPPGITAVASQYYVDVTAAASAATGTFNLGITVATASHSTTLTVPVTVIEAPPTRPVAFRMCRAQHWTLGSLVEYAYANEGSSWVEVVRGSDQMIRFDATDRVAFAEFFSYPGFYGPGSASRVLYLTADELQQMQCPDPSMGQVAFPVVAANASKHAAALGAWRFENGFTQVGKQPGAADLVASATRDVASGVENRIIVRRSQNLASGDVINVDFASAEALVADSASITWSGATGMVPQVRLHTSSTIGHLAGLTNTTSRYFAVPEGLLLPGDMHSLRVTTPFGTAIPRGAIHWFRTATPLTITFGPEVSAPVLDVSSQTISLAVQPEYPDIAAVSQRHTVDFRGIYNYLEIWQSKAYLGGAPASWIFPRPDLGRLGSVALFSESALIGAMAGSGPSSLFLGGTGETGSVLRWSARTADQFPVMLPFPTNR